VPLRLQLPLIFLAAVLAQAAAPKPNLVVILADDMGYADAGCYGGEIETPHLDRLAAGGLRFTQGYSTGRCWPSRAAILSGYYAKQVNLDPVRQPLPAFGGFIPRYLRPAGYRSYHSGKWHIRNQLSVVEKAGFDRSYSLDDHNRFFSPKNHRRDDQELPEVGRDEGYYATTAIADHAIECLRDHREQHAGQPFFSYVAFTAPHFPLMAPAADVARYDGRYDAGWDTIRKARYEKQRRLGLIDCELSPPLPEVSPHWNLPEAELRQQIDRAELRFYAPWPDLGEAERRFQADKMEVHAAMIDRMDREIGRILDQLRAMDALEHTLVVFVSDNGSSAEQLNRGDLHTPGSAPGSADSYLCLGAGWSTVGNTPFRRHKSWMDEGGIASPFILHWPGGIADAGALRRAPVHFIDLLPTFLELAGADAAPAWKPEGAPPLPGRSLTSLFERDGALDREFLYWEHLGSRALRIGDWKILASDKGDDWKLHHLGRDRGELRDLAAAEPERVETMAAKWRTLTRQFEADAAR